MSSHLIRRHALPLAAALLVVAASSAHAQFVYEQNANGQLLEQDSCGFNHSASNNNFWTQAEMHGTDCHSNPILTDVSNWNFPNYPNSTTASANLGAFNVHLNESVSIGSLTIGTGGVFTVDTGNSGGAGEHSITFTIAGPTLTDNGTLFAGNSEQLTTISIPSAVSLTGTGKFQLAHNLIVSGAGTLTVGANELLEGISGSTVTTKLINNGTILSDGGGDIIFNGPTLTNNNLIGISGAGFIELRGGTVDNTAGTISATGTNYVILASGVAVAGGILKSSGDDTRTNYYSVQGGGCTLSDLTFATGSAMEVNTPMNITGTITNNGNIYVDNYDFNGGGAIRINVLQNATLAGNGQVSLRGGGFVIGTSSNLTATLTNDASHTIIGSGSISGGTLVNKGIINCNGSTLTFTTATVTNAGTIENINNGMVSLGGTVNNTGGTLSATADGLISINGANITGGTLKSSGDATRVNYFRTDGGGSFTNLTIATGTAVEVNNPFGLAGTIVNNGKIQVDGYNFNSGLYSSLEIAHNTTVKGTGSIFVNRINIAKGATLTQGPTHSLIGSGTITGTFVNAGGTISANLTTSGSFTQTSGTIDLDGGTVTPQQGLDLDGGTIVGTGSINGVVRNNSGGVAPGHSPGTITISGDYIQGAKGQLDMQIGGATDSTDYDKLVVNGTATLGGTLNITLINGYKPKVGDVYTLVSASAFKGKFSKVNVNGFSGQVDTSTNGVTITITTASRQLLNIATRLNVLTGNNVLIGGFIITGSDPKQVLIEAIGPSLTKYGVMGALADPVLELHKPDSSVVTNDNWKTTQQAAIQATGLAPSDDHESAILATLAPGAYTAIVRGNNSGTGVAIVQAYDRTPTVGELGNIATRGFVDNGENVMIGGFIIGGGTVGTSASVLIRGIGPSLAKVGITGALQDPTLELHDANGNILKSNDNWKTTQAAAIQATGLAPSDDRESAILATLAPGSYTAILRGKNNTTGVGLVEVYNVATQ